MLKEDFLEILQASLLAFDGVTYEELIEKYGIYPELAQWGMGICKHLQSQEIKVVTT